MNPWFRFAQVEGPAASVVDAGIPECEGFGLARGSRRLLRRRDPRNLWNVPLQAGARPAWLTCSAFEGVPLVGRPAIAGRSSGREERTGRAAVTDVVQERLAGYARLKVVAAGQHDPCASLTATASVLPVA